MTNKHVIEKKVSKEEWTKALTSSFNKNVKEVSVEGFRKGKCPRNIYEKNGKKIRKRKKRKKKRHGTR